MRKTRRSFHSEGDTHAFTFSCHQRRKLLKSDLVKGWFLEALDNARTEYEVLIWGYVLMPEHVHLVVHPKHEVFSSASFLAALKRPVAGRAVAHLRDHRPNTLDLLKVVSPSASTYRFWQKGGGYDANLTDARAVWEMLEYIHANPVKRGLVEVETDYRWSSSRQYHGIASDIAFVADLCKADLG